MVSAVLIASLKTKSVKLYQKAVVFFIIRQLLIHVFIFAEAIVTSGKTEKSPHDQEIKFFAKVSDLVFQVM